MGSEKRIFVSLPMQGRGDEAIEADRFDYFQVGKEFLQEEDPECDIVLIPSFFKGRDRENLKPLRMLGMALELLSAADLAVFAPGWEEGRGCRIEHECAVQYGIRILDLSNGQIEKELQ